MMNPAASSSFASSPFDHGFEGNSSAAATTTPTTTQTTPESSSSSSSSSGADRSRKCIVHASIFASLVAFGWYLNKGISTVISYHTVSQEFESWESSWALVTARNKTYPGISSVGPFLPLFTDDPYYCAILTYETVDGDKMLATSQTNCGHLPTEVIIGEEMEILYNPDSTQEVLEKDVIDESLDALIGAIAIVFVFSFGFLSCAILLWVKRDVPIGLERNAHHRRPARRRVRDNDNDDEMDIELTPEELEKRKKVREEKILKHFHFETVSGSGVDASFSPSLTKSTSEDASETTEPSSGTDASLPQEDGHSDDECCICMEKYFQGDRTCTPTTDECKHIFHKACLLEWLQRHDHCPLCRVNLVQDE